jgi:predicted RNase H-like HicB family nuclease
MRPDLEDVGYNASCPALPGCHSQGETEAEAINNIREAIEGCLDALNERARVRSSNEKMLEMAVL